jgi:hypothetical protein
VRISQRVRMGDCLAIRSSQVAAEPVHLMRIRTRLRRPVLVHSAHTVVLDSSHPTIGRSVARSRRRQTTRLCPGQRAGTPPAATHTNRQLSSRKGMRAHES